MFNKGRKEDINLDELLLNLRKEEVNYDDAKALVKSIQLKTEEDLKTIIEELKKGNIILLKMDYLYKKNIVQLKTMIGQIKKKVKAMDGDVGRISETLALLTPPKVKIYRK